MSNSKPLEINDDFREQFDDLRLQMDQLLQTMKGKKEEKTLRKWKKIKQKCRGIL